MRVKIELLYFAALKDLVGTAREALEIELSTPSVAELCAELERRRPELAGRLGSVRVAVNESFAEAGELIPDGATVALIPPVSGG
ncbi:MAG: molybdopterin converting factor subunit 1 [Polyangiaceae bacterium]